MYENNINHVPIIGIIIIDIPYLDFKGYHRRTFHLRTIHLKWLSPMGGDLGELGDGSPKTFKWGTAHASVPPISQYLEK